MGKMTIVNDVPVGPTEAAAIMASLDVPSERDVLEEILATLQRIEANQKRGRWHR